MASISNNLNHFQQEISSYDCSLVAVSKTKPLELLEEAYAAGQRIFGENIGNLDYLEYC